MKKNKLNFMIDFLSFINLAGLAGTGFIVKYILPPGSGGRGRGFRGGRGGEHIKSLLSMTRHQWGDIHFYLAVCFLILMIVHIVLHWGWIKETFKSVFTASAKS